MLLPILRALRSRENGVKTLRSRTALDSASGYKVEACRLLRARMRDDRIGAQGVNRTHRLANAEFTMKVIRIQEPSSFFQTLKTLPLPTATTRIFALFFGSESPSTNNESWCPDCVIADPVIRSSIREVVKDVVLLECPVGQKLEWRANKSHEYRVNPDLKIERIPTLIEFTSVRGVHMLWKNHYADWLR